jgi:hypothetical protein
MPETTRSKASPNRVQLGLAVSQETADRLIWLCELKAREYAARGLTRSARNLQSETISELIFKAWTASQKSPKKS